MPSLRYRRIVLKISGESLCTEGEGGLAEPELMQTAAECAELAKTGVELAIVVGGGNWIRGKAFAKGGKFPQAVADHMGMLATVMNALALQEALESCGTPTRVLSSISIQGIAEPFSRRRAISLLKKHRVVIFAGGTGAPFFSTDTCASLRAAEIGADAVLKGTKVDGVYSDDPRKNPAATRYDEIRYQDVLARRLGVMDLTAIAMCMEHQIPLVVFNAKVPGNIKRVVEGEAIGTRVIA